MNTGDFKLLSRRVVNELLKLNEYDPFLRGLVRWVGFKQTQIFYDRQPRHAGLSHFQWHSKDSAKAMVAGITSFGSYPLYLSFIVGLFVSLGAFVYLTAIIISRLVLEYAFAGLAIRNGHDAVSRWTEPVEQRHPEHLRSQDQPGSNT